MVLACVPAYPLQTFPKHHPNMGPFHMASCRARQHVGRWVYDEPGWARVAGLAPHVVSCAQAGDQVAQQILQEGCSDLVKTVEAVVRRLQMIQRFKLVLAGLLHVFTDGVIAPSSQALLPVCGCIAMLASHRPKKANFQFLYYFTHQFFCIH